MKELVELKTKEGKEQEDKDKNKNKDQRMPTIDVKDVKRPEEYDGDEKNFPVWYQRFKGLLINRHSSWTDVFEAVEAFQHRVIENEDGKHEKFKEKLPQDSLAMDDPDMYARQLTSYLGSYTKGLLHSKVMKTQSRGSFELLRDLVHKGRNRNKNRLLSLKASVLSPPRAPNLNDLEKILIEWEHQLGLIKEYEDAYILSEDTKMTLLLTMIPKEFVKDMRDIYNKGDCKNDFHAFRQKLLDEIADRKQDAEGTKGLKGIMGVATDDGAEQEPSNGRSDEYGEVDVWVESMQCWMSGMAPLGALAHKRPAGDDAGDGNRDDKKRREECYNCGEVGHRAFECTKPRVDRNKGKGKKGDGKGSKGGKGSRMPGPCYTCGGPHLARECPTAGKGGKGFPVSAAWSSWRPPAFPGPSPQQWRQWMPRKGAEKGKGKGKGKSGISELSWNYPAPWGAPLGQVQATQNADMSQWLVPICAVTETTADQWNAVKRCAKIVKIEVKPKMPYATRFAALACNEEDHIGFPDIATATKTATTNTRMPKWMDKRTQKDKKKKAADEFGELLGEAGRSSCGCMEARSSIAQQPPRGCGVRGGIVLHADEPAGETPRTRRASRPVIREKICSKNYMAACECSGEKFGGHLQVVSFVDQAEVVRSQCMAEREHCSCAEVAPRCILADDRPINEIQGGGKIFDGGWQMITMAVDSGAAETVIPHTLVMGHPIVETAASKSGVNYASATGQPIPNLGEQRLPLCTSEGSLRSMTFQAAPVSRALGSVKRMNETGHVVVFDGADSYIQNKVTGEINWLREENGNYLMDLWIMPMDDLNEMKRQSFGRQH